MLVSYQRHVQILIDVCVNPQHLQDRLSCSAHEEHRHKDDRHGRDDELFPVMECVGECTDTSIGDSSTETRKPNHVGCPYRYPLCQIRVGFRCIVVVVVVAICKRPTGVGQTFVVGVSSTMSLVSYNTVMQLSAGGLLS